MLETRSTIATPERGEVSLARLVASRIDLARWLGIAIGMADELGAIHARGTAHLALRPDTIRIRGDRIDLGEPLRIPPTLGGAPKRTGWPPSAWPYLSPEQTGRLAVEVDRRSDLYSLGVILHELLTGRKPLRADDLPGWIHAHVAVRPPAASDVVPAVPRVVSDIVLRLLAKAPEDRYQSAAGLRHDLALCLERWRASSTIEPFPLGRMDVPSPPRITAALHGRDDELDRLIGALDRASSEERPRVVLVSGPAGVGKSSLVDRLRGAAVDRGAIVAVGKSAAGAETQPLRAAQQALDGLIAAALESNAWSPAELRAQLGTALGPQAPLLASVLPDLARTLGVTPLPEPPGHDAETRLPRVVATYLGALATPRAPVVIVLDDLQWADAATLGVLEQAVIDPAVHHTLVIGAYREGDADRPPRITELVRRLGQQGAEPATISLRPLALDALQRWLADVLCRPLIDVEPLARVVHERTGGSPLFVAQFVEALYHEGAIRYAPPQSSWVWDLERIRAKRYSDDVADLIAERIRTLSPRSQDALRLFAAHGASADLATLAIVIGEPETVVLERLGEAFAARLVARVGDELRFLHDRIHQSAYELTPPERRAETHRAIARALLARAPEPRPAERVFEIVRHVDLGASADEPEPERARIAELHLAAGRAARIASDVPAAIAFLERGIAWLDPSAWETRYELAFRLHLALARARFASGDLDATDALCRDLVARARDHVDRARVSALLSNELLLRGRMSDAVDACLDGLRALGIDLPPRPSDGDVDRAYDALLARLGDDPASALRDDPPPMRSDEFRAACDLLAAVHAPAAYLDWKLVWLAGCAGVDLTLRHGSTSSSPAAYSTFALGLADRRRRYADAFAFGEAAYRIALRPENAAHRAHATFAFVALLSYLQLPLRRCVAMLREESAQASAVGDLAYACYNAKHAADFRLAAGDPLDEVVEEAARASQFARRAGYSIVADILAGRVALIAALRGAPATTDPLEHAEFPLTRFHGAFHELVRAFVLGDRERAAAAGARARSLAGSAVGFLITIETRFFAALAETSRTATSDPGARGPVPARVREDLEVLEALAASAPESFADRAALVRAELSRIDGDPYAAERAYEDAIRLARRSQAVHVEAVACELASRFHASRGLETGALAYLIAAHDAYELWGAHARARALRAERPEIAAASRAGRHADSVEATGMLKASQAITGALLAPDLHARLLEFAIEQAGAQRGCLLLADEDGMKLAAARGPGAEAFGELHRPVAPVALPLAMCEAAKRTQRAVLLPDACASHRWSADPYFAHPRTRSALALPIVREGHCKAVVYLENDLVAGAFSGDQLAVLDVLASQAAISLENAKLYEGLWQEIRERRSTEEQLQRSESRLHGIIENATALVWVKDLAGRYELVNHRFAELVGLDPHDVVGMTDHQLFAAEVADALFARDRQAVAEDRVVESDDSIPHLDGVHDYLTERAPLRDASGRVHAVCGIATDVTARNRDAKKLRHTLSLIEAAFESTADGILVVDHAHRIVRTNRRFAEIWRVPHEIEDALDDARAIAFVRDQLEDPEAFEARIRALYDAPEEHSFDTLRFRDGRVVERYSQPQKLGDEIVGRVWSFRDVTQRVRAEEQRDRLLDEEKRARTDAEEAVRVRDEFLSIASHELRTPLTSLQLAIDGLALRMSRKGTIDPAQLERALGVSKRQLRRLTALVGLLLDVSRVRDGRLDLHRTAVDLRVVVGEVGALLADELARSGSTLVLEPGAPVIGLWDALRVEQIVTNLLTNAIKFGRGLPIEVRVSREGDEAVLAVRDQGVGIADEVRTRLFHPFQRGVSWRHYGGLGLGLFITRTIAEAHGGGVEVASELEHGSTFTVRLPLAPAEGPSGPRDRGEPGSGTGGSTPPAADARSGGRRRIAAPTEEAR